MQRTLMTLAILLIATTALGQADPDMIGIYFDEQAETNYWWSEPFELVPIYLIITNPTATSIAGWECSLDWDMGIAMLLGDIFYSGDALNVLDPPAFAVGLASPLPAQEATVLLWFNVFLLNDNYCALTVDASPIPSTPDEFPLYVDGNDLSHLILLGNPTGYDMEGDPLPCAFINYDTTANNTTWSGVKSLFR